MGLFGTDGVRGVANTQLTVELATKIGKAMARQLPTGGRIAIGRDTRVSSPMLEAALSAGITSSGRNVLLCGMLPTPALAYLIPHLSADAGVMISASHNPPQYNGIKLLDRWGRKWSQEAESAVEHEVQTAQGEGHSDSSIGRIYHWEDSVIQQYHRYLIGLFAGKMPPCKVVIDVAHGAAIATAPAILQRLGLSVTVLHGEDQGLLINQGCGATHPEVLRQAVLDFGADVGLSFDGDADRVIAVDHTGRIVDGDALLYVLATAFKEQGKLPGDTVVATVMSNLGLERALQAQGIRLVRTAVGDRWVAESLRIQGAGLGGEQSGHVILSEWSETGDGLLTALAILAEMGRRNQTLSNLVEPVEQYPQILVNVPIDQPLSDWRTIEGLEEAVTEAEQVLGATGRVLIRPSGTEPLLRIMLEGRDTPTIHQWADRLQMVVQHALESAKA